MAPWRCDFLEHVYKVACAIYVKVERFKLTNKVRNICFILIQEVNISGSCCVVIQLSDTHHCIKFMFLLEVQKGEVTRYCIYPKYSRYHI